MEGKLTFRAVLIGDASVGKTSILNKFLRDVFDPNELNTVGAFYDSYSRQRDGREVQIELWDTAGQEEYRALGPIYFRNASAALVVFDITSIESFSHLTEWIKSFRNVTGDNTKIVIVGNKCDLEDRAVEMQIAEDWAKSQHCSYVETSAATGLGIDQLFEGLIDRLTERLVGEPSSPSVLQRPALEPAQGNGGCC
jgi:small GTP-binding protein